MIQEFDNIVLIGMSGAGKSTVGKMLAEILNWNFLDIDRELEVIHKIPLQKILDTSGMNEFIHIEAKYLREAIKKTKQVIAPGGSIVYKTDTMESLPSNTIIIYLETDFKNIQSRIEQTSRGIVGLGEKSLAELFYEREVLYKKYANKTVNTNNKTPEAVANEIICLLKQ